MVIQSLDNILVRGQIQEEVFMVIQGLDNISLVRGWIIVTRGDVYGYSRP